MPSERVTDHTPRSEQSSPAPSSSESGKVRLAVFDFDGTSIDGNSPVMLVSHLARRRMIGKRITLRIALWGLRYKLRLPQNESWVRGMVFSAFEGKPVAEAMELTNKAVAEALDGLPAHKLHCSVLAEEAIKKALEDYYRRRGIAYEPQCAEDACPLHFDGE